MSGDPNCTCVLALGVQGLSGFHIERLSAERAREILFEKSLAAEPPPLNEKRRRELWQEAADLAGRYEGTQIVLERCPASRLAERARQDVARAKSRKEGKGRMRPRSEE